MIASIITDLTGLKADVTTVSTLLFLAALVIYFFAAIKPGLDQKARINRQAKRMYERDQAVQKYKAMKAASPPAAQSKAPIVNKPSKPFFNHSKIKKGFAAFTSKRSAQNKQIVKHSRMNSVAQFNRSSKAGRTTFVYPNASPNGSSQKLETMEEFQKRFAESGQVSMKLPKHLSAQLDKAHASENKSNGSLRRNAWKNAPSDAVRVNSVDDLFSKKKL